MELGEGAELVLYLSNCWDLENIFANAKVFSVIKLKNLCFYSIIFTVEG